MIFRIGGHKYHIIADAAKQWFILNAFRYFLNILPYQG